MRQLLRPDATNYDDLENVFVKAQELLGGKIDFVLHSIGMSPNVRKHRTYDDLDYNWLNKTLDIFSHFIPQDAASCKES